MRSFNEVLQQRAAPLLSDVHLPLKVTSVSDLGSFDLPREVLHLDLELCLNVLEAVLGRARLDEVRARVRVLQRVTTLAQQVASGQQVLPVDPRALTLHDLFLDSVLDLLPCFVF